VKSLLNKINERNLEKSEKLREFDKKMKNFIYGFLIFYIVEQITLSIILKDSGLFDKPPNINGVNTYIAIFIAIFALIRWAIQLTTFYIVFGVLKLVKHYMISHEDYDTIKYATKYFAILTTAY
jgi:hypothetical protein